MVFLGLEKPVEYGSRQIFDPTMANMVLQAQKNYIDAMKDDYLRGREDLKEFNKNFGDFFSPIQKDMEWYDQNVTGATRDLINNLYAQGIDPLRSVEGRSLISRWVNNMPVGKINQLKQSAAAANEYLDNLGKLEAAGKYSKDFEDFVNGGISLDTWDTANNGMWTRRSPAEMKTLKELTESWYNNRTAGLLTPDEVAEFGMKYDPRYDYYGFSRKSLADIAAGQTPGWNDGIHSQYYREVAKRQLQREGWSNPTQKQIEDQLQANIAQANEEYLIRPEMKANQYALARYTNSLAMQRDAINNAARAARANSRGGGGGRGNSKTPASVHELNYNDSLAHAASGSGTKYDPYDLNYEQVGKNIIREQSYFGSNLGNISSSDRNNRFESRYTKWVNIADILRTHGQYKNGEKSVEMNISDVPRIRTREDVITNTQGNSNKPTNSSSELQSKIEEALRTPGVSVRMYPTGKKYGAQSKLDSFDIDAQVDIVITDAKGNQTERYNNVYWDTYWGNRETTDREGQYYKDVPSTAYADQTSDNTTKIANKDYTTMTGFRPINFGNVNVERSRNMPSSMTTNVYPSTYFDPVTMTGDYGATHTGWGAKSPYIWDNGYFEDDED